MVKSPDCSKYIILSIKNDISDLYTLDDLDKAIRISELIIGAIDERWNMLKIPSSPARGK